MYKKMNNKGMTIVELIVSFALTMVIALFLTEIVLFLKDVYVVNGVKSEVIMKETFISDRINSSIKNKTITSITTCGTNCKVLIFSDYTSETISFDTSVNVVTVGDYSTSLPNNAKIKSVSFSISNVAGVATSTNDSFFRINVILTSSLLGTDEFPINILYPFDSRVNNLTI